MRHRSGLISSCGRRLQMLWTDIYLNRVCAKVLWDQCLQSIIGYRAVETWEGQFIENDGVRIWLEKMLEITSTEIRTSVLDTSWSCHGQAICQLFEMKRLFLFIGNLAASIVENVSTQAEEQPLCKTYTRRSELFRTNHFWRVDKVSDEIKPHDKKQEILQQSLIVVTFFYRKSFLLHFLQSPATCSIREQSNFTNLVIQG